MGQKIKGFRTIQGDILITGSSTVGPSRRNGMYYSSKGGNSIWKVFDKAVEELTGTNPGFVKLIESYKSIKFSNNDFSFVEQMLDKGFMLCDLSNDAVLPSANIADARKIQKEIISLMEKYGFGFTDAISECVMDGTADNSRKTINCFNENIYSEMAKAKITITNGMSTTKNGSVGSIRSALNCYGKRNEKEWLSLKQKLNIVDGLPSTSGTCGSTSKNKSLKEDKKIELWVDVIKKYIKIN